MNSPTVDISRLVFARAKKENSGAMLDIIRRCVSEVNAADYTQAQVRELLDGFTANWLENIISTRHYYEAWYDGKLVACGGVSREYSQEKQSYLTAVFVRPDFRKNGIGRKLVEFLEKDEWCLDSNLIRAEVFIPRRLRRNKGYEIRQQHLMRTTYLDASVEVC